MIDSPKPAVMQPVFSVPATVTSLAMNAVAVAGALVTVATPLHTLLGEPAATYVNAACLVIVAIGSAHLSMSRSILPSVDNPPSSSSIPSQNVMLPPTSSAEKSQP